jgi:hypothetical protein
MNASHFANGFFILGSGCQKMSLSHISWASQKEAAGGCVDHPPLRWLLCKHRNLPTALIIIWQVFAELVTCWVTCHVDVLISISRKKKF